MKKEMKKIILKILIPLIAFILLLIIITAIYFHMLEKIVEKVGEVANEEDLIRQVNVVEVGKDENGNPIYGYEIDNELKSKISERLSSMGISPSAFDLNKESEILDKMLQAEVVTSYPKLGNMEDIVVEEGKEISKNYFQGDIVLQYGSVDKDENGNKLENLHEMKYVPKEKLEEFYNGLEYYGKSGGKTSVEIEDYKNTGNRGNSSWYDVDVVSGGFNKENGELEKMYIFKTEDERGEWDLNKYPSLYSIAYGTPEYYQADQSQSNLPYGIPTWNEYNVDRYLGGISDETPFKYFTLDDDNNIVILTFSKEVKIKGNNISGRDIKLVTDADGEWIFADNGFYVSSSDKRKAAARHEGWKSGAVVKQGFTSEAYVDTRKTHTEKTYTRTVKWTVTKQTISHRNMVSKYSTPIELSVAMHSLLRNKQFINAFLDTIIKDSRIDMWIQDNVSEEFNQRIYSTYVNAISEYDGKPVHLNKIITGDLYSSNDKKTTIHLRTAALYKVKTWIYSKNKEYERKRTEENLTPQNTWVALTEEQKDDVSRRAYDKESRIFL